MATQLSPASTVYGKHGAIVTFKQFCVQLQTLTTSSTSREGELAQDELSDRVILPAEVPNLLWIAAQLSPAATA
jgi:hypothetical protein